ncbi:DUF302 domain-containing protein [Ectothiorhodospiraceae bacterium 2226]|nr:DUF302 domain-containing protein [Ectothiorhodospiraceae bacterium 2226]
MKKLVTCLSFTVLLLGFAQHSVAESDELFIVHEVAGSPAELAARIQQYATAQEDWIFLAEFPLKGGELTAVKICYLPIGEDIFAAGLHVGAMMPCGHIAVYEEDGTTRMSMLHPRFMTVLHPDPNLARAVERAEPAFEAMLDELGIQ